MKNLLVIFLFLSVGTLLADVPADFCDIKRGDANCDTYINLTDVQNIANGIWDNADAADCNDNGENDFITDAIYLANWLFQGGPPTPCPGAQYGWDATPDDLENCTSPPVEADTDFFPAWIGCNGDFTANYDLNIREWDQISAGYVLGSPDTYILSWYNYPYCGHSQGSTPTDFVAFAGDDEPDITLARLGTGLEKMQVYYKLSDFEATTNSFCPSQNCPAQNYLGVSFEEFGIRMVFTSDTEDDLVVEIPISGVESAQNAWESENYYFTCLTHTDPEFTVPFEGAEDVLDVTNDIIAELEAQSADFCDSYTLDSVQLVGIEGIFGGSGLDGKKDILGNEYITIKLELQWRYLWSPCEE